MNPSTKTTTLIGILIVLVIVAGLLLALSRTAKEQRLLSIQSYAECVQAGYPIMESYPSQCATPDGRVFVNPDEHAQAPGGSSSDILVPAATSSSDCVIGGCSSQLCGERGDMDQLVSSCEYRAEYGCYKKFSACERQANGKCGWTPTPQLAQCLKNPPQGDSSSLPQ